MRIISGKFKATKLESPLDKYTRPLKDIVKESIFNFLFHSNKINFQIKNSEVLDIFSGVGTFGLECISRGSKRVVFIEKYMPALKVLNININKLNAEQECEVISEDIIDAVLANYKFDLIFLDPPYKNENILDLLKQILSQGVLKKNCLIILHRHVRSRDKLPKELIKFETRNYGKAKIEYFKLR